MALMNLLLETIFPIWMPWKQNGRLDVQFQHEQGKRGKYVRISAILHSEFFPSLISVIPLGSNIICDLLFWLRRAGSLGQFHLASLQSLWSSDPTDPPMQVEVSQLSYIYHLAVTFLETGGMAIGWSTVLTDTGSQTLTSCDHVFARPQCLILNKWMWVSLERGRGDCCTVQGPLSWNLDSLFIRCQDQKLTQVQMHSWVDSCHSPDTHPSFPLFIWTEEHACGHCPFILPMGILFYEQLL